MTRKTRPHNPTFLATALERTLLARIGGSAITPESRMILRDLKAVPSNIKESLTTLIHQTAVMFARKTQDD